LILRILIIQQHEIILVPLGLHVPRPAPHGATDLQRRGAAQFLDALRHPRLDVLHLGGGAQVRDVRGGGDGFVGAVHGAPDRGAHFGVDIAVQARAVFVGRAPRHGRDEVGQVGHGFLERARRDAVHVRFFARARLVDQLEIRVLERVVDEWRPVCAVFAVARIDCCEGFQRCSQRFFVYQGPHPWLAVARMDLVALQ
ncbi:MAG: hypothetical protein Q9191_005631, partial [Dirinaria sp. TL-2023a]